MSETMSLQVMVASLSSSLPSVPRFLSGFLLFLSFGRTPGFGIKGGDVIQKEIQIEVQEFLALPVIKVKRIFGVVARKPAAISIDNGSVLFRELVKSLRTLAHSFFIFER